MNQINWREIKQFKSWIEEFEKIRQDGRESVRRLGESLLFQNGQTLYIELSVNDPEVAQAVLLSAFSEQPSLLPGFDVKSVQQDDIRKDAVRKWLSDQLRALDEDSP